MKKHIKVDFKRRMECKTDYKARIGMLKSGIPRMVIRKTNHYIIIEIVKSREGQDFVVCYANSKELEKFGWTGNFKNIPAAYLTGILIASKAKKKGINEAIIDIGCYRSTKGSKLYAAVKGSLDNELKIPCNDKILPDEERIKGSHTKNAEKIAKIFNKIKEKIIKE